MTERFWSQAVQDHENMMTALEQRDGKQLGQILRDHLCNKLEVATLSGVVDTTENQQAAVNS